MSLNNIVDVPPLDPGNMTGPTRLLGPAVDLNPVVLDTPYPNAARYLYVSVTGDVNIVKWNGESQLIENLLPGALHPIGSLMVNSTNTTASGILWGS